MEPIKSITQNELGEEIIDNPIDQAGNRIKLRSVSHKNLIKHLKNIPYQAKKEPKVESSYVEMPEGTKKWNLTPKQYMEHIDAGRKPINVKETMLENIRKHSEPSSVKEETAVAVETVVTQPEEQKIEEKAVIGESEAIKTDVDSRIVSFEEKKKTYTEESDFERALEEVSNIRQEIISLDHIKAQEEADNSEKALQEAVLRHTETEKQLEEARRKCEERKRQAYEAASSQKNVLFRMKEERQHIIEEANRIKAENDKKTQEVTAETRSMEEQIVNVNNDIAKWEEIINASSLDSVIMFPQESQEEKVRKIA